MSEITECYLSNDIYILCEHFARRSYKTNVDAYKKRNQFNESKIIKDITIGKLGEFGVYFTYLNRGITNITPPDLQVYSKQQKTFDGDLKHGMFSIHVKSQSEESVSRYGSSWMFEKNDPVVSSPNEYDVFVGTTVIFLDDCTYDSVLVYLNMEKKVSDLKWGEPKLSKLNSKTCIYLKDNV